ncbi:unnamed protein product [Rotaria sp. Silwood2]|nr:unnamed protein product [Rotaria sp. Silwood2]CAF2914033.1 unnamed protein product [Rotaria sp. Silwood2]CAF3087711.1 unnamed protein product [Rotaria sp. Silwood2]CAF3998232.1 unnamed protein product [Rotaria sp. Silwood2]CAF4254133.1 unnamed protein product [Rotaria sp. Silwood2]
MAPKTKEHSLEFRELVIKRFQNGDSEYDIAKDLICSRNTIHSIIAKYKKTKCIGNIFGRGRKRKTTSRVDQSIQRKIKQDRRKSASSVRLEIEKELGVIISSQTVRRRLHEVGLYGRTARKKPYVNKASRAKRLKYVKMYRDKDMNFWKHVLWSDESKFNLFGSDGKVIVWRSPKEEYDPVCTVPTVKHGGGNVKVWGCFAWNGVGNLVFINGNMTGEMYKDILKDNLIQSATKLNLGNEMLFQHDNDPKHTARIVKNWLDNQGIKRLIWPPFSPDMNPIEHLWDELERRMKKHQPKNENELRDILQAEWEGIGQNITNKLVESVPSRLYECLRMKGHPTRY